MSTYKGLRKNPSASQADASLILSLRDIPLAALSDNMHRNIGTIGLHPSHRPGKQTMAGTAVTAPMIEVFISSDIAPCISSRLRRSTRFVGFDASSWSSVRLIEVPLGALHELALHCTGMPFWNVIWLTKLARLKDVEASMIPNSGPRSPAEAGGA